MPLANVPLPPLKVRPFTPLFEVTLVKLKASVVPVSVAAAPAPVVAMLPPAALTVPELFAFNPMPTELVMASDVKLMVRPALLVRSTAVPAKFLLTVVAANDKLAFEVSMSMPLPPGVVIVVAPVTLTAPPLAE